MTWAARFQQITRGWRGPALAAFVAFLAGLPGVFTVPPLDRDESRFAQATAQMLETGDFVVIRFQDQPRFKKPVGIHWMQAASVSLLSDAEAREIWAYRIPSLLGAMLAAAACAWGAAAFFGASGGAIAGMLLGASFLLSTEAFIAKTDAMLCGTTTLALAALGRLYAADRGGPPAGRLTRWLFWLGLSASVLIKGPVGLMVVALTLLSLWAWDRRAGWMKSIGWGWGLILFVAIVGPWAGAVTVATDGQFWITAIGGDFAPKLAGGHETHGGPFGYHTLLAPARIFPGALLLPAALVLGWRGRNEPGVRFALCWLIPAWLVFEITPTKLVHYTLPTYGALAWLMAASLAHPLGVRVRWGGAILAALIGAAFAAGVFSLTAEYGDASDLTAAVLSGGLLLTAGLIGAFLLLRGSAAPAVAATGVLVVLGHGAMAALLVPRLEPLLLSSRVERVLQDARLLPRQGLAPAPVAVAGYSEPSLVFALGTRTDLGGPDQAAEALTENRPAVVEAREQAAFDARMREQNRKPRLLGVVSGKNYSNNDDTTLRVYAPQ